MQNIDKVAFGIAGLLILGAIAYGFLVPDAASGQQEKITTYSDTIERKLREQRPSAVEIPEYDEDMKRQFAIGTRDGIKRWSAYRKPAVLVVNKTPDRNDPVHDDATIEIVRNVRDAEKKRPVHVVDGAIGESAYAEIVDAWVEIQTSDGWTRVADIGARTPGGRFQIEIVDELVAGSEFTYRVVTKAKSTSDITLPPEKETLVSNEVGPVLVPFDSAWEVTSVQTKNVSGGGFTPGSCFVRRHWYDYAAGEVQKTRSKSYSEAKKLQEWDSGPAVHETEYRLYKIEEGENPEGVDDRVVRFRLPGGSRDEILSIWSKLELPPLTADDVEGISLAGASGIVTEDSADAVGDMDDAVPMEATSDADDATPAPASGGGDDDSDW